MVVITFQRNGKIIKAFRDFGDLATTDTGARLEINVFKSIAQRHAASCVLFLTVEAFDDGISIATDGGELVFCGGDGKVVIFSYPEGRECYVVLI